MTAQKLRPPHSPNKRRFESLSAERQPPSLDGCHVFWTLCLKVPNGTDCFFEIKSTTATIFFPFLFWSKPLATLPQGVPKCNPCPPPPLHGGQNV